MKNPAASVRARLLNLSREIGEPLDALMAQYAMGRFLYRLAHSAYRDRFILKGAQLFRIWGAEHHRPTRDLDLLGHGEASEAAIQSIFSELIRMPTGQEDGLEWGGIQATPIREDLAYGGVRAVLAAHLAGARLSLQVDVGFGDAITPKAEEAEWQELLDVPAARLLIYPAETVVAEKLEAAITLGWANSRMKDLFDLHWLSAHQSFAGDLLIESVQATFARRETAFPEGLPPALTEAFATDATKQVQWKAFLRKNRLDGSPFEEIIARLSAFLVPVLTGKAKGRTWKPEIGWSREAS